MNDPIDYEGLSAGFNEMVHSIDQWVQQIDWVAFEAEMNRLVNVMRAAIDDVVKAFAQIYADLEAAYEAQYLDSPMPREEPVDYVLRVGARSGFFIYPDEAWRYRANLDWWKPRKRE